MEKDIFIDESTKPMSIKEVCEYFEIDICDSVEEIAEEVIRQNDGIKTLHVLWHDGKRIEC